MSNRMIVLNILGAALLSGGVLRASTPEGGGVSDPVPPPVFTIQATITDSSGQPSTMQFQAVDSLVLKQVPLPSVTPSGAAVVTFIIGREPQPAPCLFTLTFTEFGDDSQIYQAIQGNLDGTEVDVAFNNLSPTSESSANLPQLGRALVALTGATSISWHGQCGDDDDDDFSSLMDFGMSKVTIKFRYCNITSVL